MMDNSIKLQTDTVLHAPLLKYSKDFIFIVNSEVFETSSFIADLLSPIISYQHSIDPTLNEFVINTKSRGDFNKIISLINFEQQEIDESDFQFIIEILDKLGTEKVELNLKQKVEVTNDNIFEQIKFHQSHPQFYKHELNSDIEYFTSHFYELKEKVLENIRNEEFDLNDEVFESIISSSQLVLETEDDLLQIVIEMYLKDSKNSKFFEFIDFKNVEQELMKKFIQIFDINDLSSSTWISICDRLQYQILLESGSCASKHECTQKSLTEISDKPNEFDGLLNYLQKNFNIKNELNITSSSNPSNDPFNLLKYEDKSTYFQTNDPSSSWICFEFKNHQIIPSSYIIRSYYCVKSWHLKTWVFEGSNDNKNWTILDEQNNNDSLNGANRVKSFIISNKRQSFKYLRIRQTGKNWYENNGLLMNSIEFYGKVI